jgi:TorA maturation chaperone TorD
MLKDVLKIEDEEVGAGETAALLAAPAETAAECRARAAIYRLLSGVFIEEAANEFLAALRAPELQAQLADSGLRFDADFTEVPLDALTETLAVEYATLFAASGGFPPVESVRLYGRYKQEPNFETMQIYRRLGFALQPGRHEVFADQLGVELLFVAELLERQAALLDAGDMTGQRKIEKEVKRFWTQHLGRWVRGYARLIEHAAAHSFYREMARFLGGFAEEEIAAMGLRIEDADQARLEVPKAEIRVEFDPNEPVCNGCVGEAIGRQADGARTLHDLRA